MTNKGLYAIALSILIGLGMVGYGLSKVDIDTIVKVGECE